MHAFDRQTDRQTDVDSKTVRMLRSRTVKTYIESADDCRMSTPDISPITPLSFTGGGGQQVRRWHRFSTSRRSDFKTEQRIGNLKQPRQHR